MKAKDLNKLTVKELEEKYKELHTQLVKERAQVARGTQSKNPYIIKNTRKNIARIKMILMAKEEKEASSGA